jgi:transcriptional regulator with XRE-family HTH domain
MTLQIHPDLRAYIDPLTDIEYQTLEQSLLADGCRDALIVWGDTLVDGHNRYTICEKHSIPYTTKQLDHCNSIEDVMLWMIDNHLARRSVTQFQRGVLALRKKDLLAARLPAPSSTTSENEEHEVGEVKQERRVKRQEIAKIAGVSPNAVSQIEKIHKAATPELVQAVRAGTISINAAANIASLPENEQVAAVAGGKKELQQAAKNVREQKAQKVRELKQLKAGNSEDDNETSPKPALTELEQLQQRVRELEMENRSLKNQLKLQQA